MSKNKPNDIRDGYQYDNGKSERCGIPIEWYGLLRHTKDSSNNGNRIELNFQKGVDQPDDQR
jgi:hypothetical protein